MTSHSEIEKQNDLRKTDAAYAWLNADVLSLAGAERVKFLNSYNSQDVARIAPLESGYGTILTQKGKLVSDTWIFNVGDSFRLLCEPGYAVKILEHLKTFLLFADVQMEDVSPQWRLAAVWGNRAEPFLRDCFGSVPDAERTLQASGLDGEIVYLFRSERFASAGWEILLPRGVSEGLERRLRDAGFRESQGDELERTRIAAGLPKMGVDMGEDNLIAEVGLDKRAASFNKGCYLGQETTARLNSQGHANRHLIRVKLARPHRGDLPLEIRSVGSDKVVGHLTSVAGQGDGEIGLGLIHRNADGERLIAADDGEPIELETFE